VLAYTGMRRGELLALRWRDVDLDGRRLSVRRSVGVIRVEGEGKRLLEGPTKGKRARVVDLDVGTVEVLRRWRAERAGVLLQFAREDALVFGRLEDPSRHQHPERYSARFNEKQRSAVACWPTPRSSRYTCTTCGTPTRPCCSRLECPSKLSQSGSGTRP